MWAITKDSIIVTMIDNYTFCFLHDLKDLYIQGRLGGTAVERLPSAQGVIPALWDRAPHQAVPL